MARNDRWITELATESHGNHGIEEEDLTYAIRGCVYEVFKVLGAGFLEQVYHRALMLELANRGLSAESEKPLLVHFKGQMVGNYVADIIVEGKVVLELKAQESLSKAHEAQLLNYLKASNLRIGLLVNFSHPKADIRRFVL